MKATKTTPITLQAARFLKLAGIILIVLSFLDYGLLLIPFTPGNVEWRLGITTQIVERGIVPILGMALVLSGLAFEYITGFSEAKPKPWWENLRVWIAVTAGFFSLLFLLLVPLHFLNVKGAQRLALEQINQDAEQAKKQLQERLAQQQKQIGQLLQTHQNLDDFLKTDKVTEEQLAQLEKFKNDPKALQEQTEVVRASLEKEIEKRKREATQRSQVGAFKSNLRICFSSLILASGYITISWSGLKNWRRFRKSRR